MTYLGTNKTSRASAEIDTLTESHDFNGSKPHPLEEDDHDPVTTEQLHRKNWGSEHSGDAEEEYDGQSEEAAAEATKAEGASCTALRKSSPPQFTGREAWIQEGSSPPSKWMLQMELKMDLSSS